MIKAARLAALTLLALTLGSCAKTTSFGASPASLYAVVPTQDQVRKLMGDSTWYQGPPTFDVPPLDAGSRSLDLQYGLRMQYLHIGSAERLEVEYNVFTTTAAATTLMTDLLNAHTGDPTTPKVGDQTLYFGLAGQGGAPYEAETFVRSGPVVTVLVLSQRSPHIQVVMLAKIARTFVDRLSNLSKVHPSPVVLDSKALPPPGLELTRLGVAILPVESFAVMTLTSIPDNFTALIHQDNIKTFVYGDYALNNDTHMEVQTAFFTLSSAMDATGWARLFSNGVTADSEGIYSQYIPTSGTPAAGEYHYIFSSGPYGMYMICTPSVPGEAASRECEGPMETTAISWELALQGIG